MEKVSGIEMMVTAAGTYSAASSKAMSLAADIFRQPTNTSAGAVAKAEPGARG